MIIESLCPPAVLYLGFSLIQIIIDLFRGQQNSAFLKVIVMIIFTILLNQLCMGGLTILSWFIVFIPFIMMTYVTTILLYVFGLNPSKGKIQPQQPDPRSRHHKAPIPYNPQEIGGCAGTEFGCCPDGINASNKYVLTVMALFQLHRNINITDIMLIHLPLLLNLALNPAAALALALLLALALVLVLLLVLLLALVPVLVLLLALAPVLVLLLVQGRKNELLE